MFEFNGSTPDITTKKPSRLFASNSFDAFYIKDCMPMAARTGASLMRYPKVFVVFEKVVRRPIIFIVLEKTSFGTTALCVHHSSGAHHNMGYDEAYENEVTFLSTAVDIAVRETAENFTEVSTKKNSWLTKLFK